MPSNGAAAISWTQVIRKAAQEFNDDNCLGLAAQLSFYFMLGLFPALLFLVALIGYVPLEDAFARLLLALGSVAPQQLVELVRKQVNELSSGSETGLLTIGVLGAIWSSSAAMVAIIDTLNRAFDVTEWRPWWKRRLVAIGLTVQLAVFLLGALVLVIVGPAVAFPLASWLGLGSAAALAWSLVRWPIMIGLVVMGIDLVYHFAPNRRRRWVWATPGGLLATTLWIAGSFIFKFYVANVGGYTAAYGAIGGAIITMLWFYVSSVAILVGAELNGVLDNARRSPTTR